MQKDHHILVIRLSAMGDVAMTVPVIRALVRQHPNIKITFVSKPFLAPLFDQIPNVTFYAAEVKGSHKGIAGLYRLYKELKKMHITQVADLHNVLRSKILRSFFVRSGIRVAAIDKGRTEKKALTRIQDKIFKQLKTTHQRYADVFEKLGFNVNLQDVPPIEFPALTSEVKAITGAKEVPWIGIAPFAAFDGKKYPLPLMEKVIEELSLKKVQVFLFGGGEKEISILKTIAEKFPNTTSVAGKLSLKNELSLIAHLYLMISMDSGNGHFSAMQQVKTITLWGVTHPFAGFAPFNQPADYCITPDVEKFPNLPCSVYGNKVCPGYENVMATIEPSAVIAKVTTILKI